MRYITCVIHRTDGTHSVRRRLVEEPGVTLEAVLSFNILNDGSGHRLARLRGDLERVRELLAKRSDVLAYDIFGEHEGLVYVHTQPAENDPLTRLLSIPREHEVFFDMPIERAGVDTMRVTMLGETSTALQRAIADVPDEFDPTLERVGEYPPNSRDLSSLLTDRQREILTVAVEMGYYDIPRRTTHRNIAEEIGLSVGTVSEHLRKVEAKIFSAIVDKEV